MDEHKTRSEVIHAAINQMRCGTQQINEVLANVRGPISKSSVKALGKQMKVLRETAESTEHVFRSWTVELSGNPSSVERTLHDKLRSSFEVEVAGIQLSMSRVASEVKLRMTAKAEPIELDESTLDDDEPLNDSIAPDTAVHEPVFHSLDDQDDDISMISRSFKPVATTNGYESLDRPLDGKSESHSPVYPPRRVKPQTMEARVSSHAAVASTLQHIASQEEEISTNRSFKHEDLVTTLYVSGSQPAARKGRSGAIHPFMKYIFWIAVTSLGCMIYVHARHLAESLQPPAQLPIVQLSPKGVATVAYSNHLRT